MAKVSFEKITLELVDQLPPRQRDVLAGRFGLQGEAPLTLEAVGSAHGITRERVRQIVEEVLAQLRREAEEKRLASALNEIANALEKAGSMRREDLLLELLQAREEANHALFLLALGEQFVHQRETRDFYPFWALRKDMVAEAKPWHARLLSFFKKKKSPVSDKELQKLHGKEVFSYLEILKAVERGHDGRWGLRTWPEVNPRGMKDKAYLVLRDAENPLHFTEVASLIGKLQASLPLSKQRPVLPQTVHNELIKDPRFVLIGRGTYGLSDWGLAPGTVKDVMRSILLSNGKTMSKDRLIAETLQQRQVKENTILLNLQDKKYFARDSEGNYTLNT